MNNILKLLVFALGLAFYGCDSSAVVNSFDEVPGGQWEYKQTFSTEAEITDTAISYDLALNVRHSSDYEFSNLFLVLKVKHPDGHELSQRVSVMLQDPSGKWYGKGFSSVKEARVPITTVRFPKKGKYTFTIQQNMRLNPLKGIEDVGLYISKSKE